MTDPAAGRGRLFQTRIHGRGGQGVVTAAELLSVAAFLDGAEAQAFPSFGSERMGAPVMSFCRISPAPIRVREPVAEPDAVVVVDATLLHHVDLFAGLAAEGYVLINSEHTPAELGIGELAGRLPAGHVVTVPATELARQHTGRPRPNVAMLGAFAAVTGAVSQPSIDTAVRERFTGKIAEGNIEAARAAYALVPAVTGA
jgi:pyruvate ferredoxin oxidoreductase gamma subunit